MRLKIVPVVPDSNYGGQSLRMVMSRGMMLILKKLALHRGCDEKQVASELLQCAIADEVAKLERLKVIS